MFGGGSFLILASLGPLDAPLFFLFMSQSMFAVGQDMQAVSFRQLGSESVCASVCAVCECWYAASLDDKNYDS